MSFQDRYNKLNAQQRRAVDTIDGPVVVVAGPGTGKTELLGVRAANILKQTDTLPENILCLTFTDSGVSAMRERLIEIIGKDAYKIAIHTFHSFGTEIINQNREFFYNGATFSPADDISRYQIIRSILEELDYNNPLRSMMNGEFTYLREIVTTISDLKRSGLTSDELLAIISNNEKDAIQIEKIITPAIDGTVNKNSSQLLRNVLGSLKESAINQDEMFSVEPLSKIFISSLESALDDAEAIHPTKPITAWKNKWFTKDSSKNYVLKSGKYNDKLRALSFVYFEYLTKMEQAGLYDYDDMILQVVHALEVHDDLRFDLQEKYLYLMVDEFQDTNLAQMRIIKSLTNSEVNESLPNIMIVGDDDQAIYSFQGADLSNITHFLEIFPKSEIVTLLDNYRSTDIILKNSRDVITQSSNRLENAIDFLSKELSANRSFESSITINQYPSINDELFDVARRIKAAIDNGTNPGDIAVLTRKHREVEAFLPYLQHFNVKAIYDKQDNALDLPPIRVINQLSEVICLISSGKPEDASNMLPELLSHPAWQRSASDIYKLGINSYKNRNMWIEQMELEDAWQPIHSQLIELAGISHNTPVEQMLDLIIGKETTAEIKMPFYDYFFADQQLQDNASTYLQYLNGLRRIRSIVNDHQSKDQINLARFIEIVNLYRQLNIPISVNRQITDDKAVNLMTVHKSKGLEFKNVFIINSVDSVWGEKVRSPVKLISYPENLPLGYAGDSIDERIRLFYVAMTRAKDNLHISFNLNDEKGKSAVVASFLSDKQAATVSITNTDDITDSSNVAWNTTISSPNQDLETALKPLVKNFKLSATHLSSFMDITNGGPRHFLLNNLLHFPSAKAPSASYGSAIHKTLQQAQLHVAANDEQKPLEDILNSFETNLKNERLSPRDLSIYTQKGFDELTSFFKAKPDLFTASQKSELNFYGQDVTVGQANITGIIDLLDINKESKTLSVIDFKTGKPLEEWGKGSAYDKIKSYKYSQQLIFYKLLVQGSRDFSKYKVEKGMLEFIEPSASGNQISLEVDYNTQQTDRLELLIQKVWDKIQNLDFPDTSQYSQDIKGILDFENDLLEGRV